MAQLVVVVDVLVPQDDAAPRAAASFAGGRRQDATALVGPVLATFDAGLDFPDLRDGRMLLNLAKSA